MLRNLKRTSGGWVALAGGAALLAMCIVPALAQDRDYDHGRDYDHDHDHMTRIERGTAIPVRTEERIYSDQAGDRIYRGRVEEDVRGENGRLAIPRGSLVELKVRTAPDNDLVLDLAGINVNGEHFRVEADADHIESQKPEGLVGAIVGAINGGQVRGLRVDVPRDTVINFRLERSMTVEAVHRDD